MSRDKTVFTCQNTSRAKIILKFLEFWTSGAARTNVVGTLLYVEDPEGVTGGQGREYEFSRQ